MSVVTTPLFLKVLKMKKSLRIGSHAGQMLNGRSGASNRRKNGMMTTPVQEKIFLGTSVKWRRSRCCRTIVLGWLLLRRANLSASSRLSVQASVNNSLKFQDIELALRDQEEELLQADQSRGSQGRRRTYWVEEEGQFGLLGRW